MSSKPYVKYDNPDVEPAVTDEAGLQDQLFKLIKRTQQHNFSIHRHAYRATHVKTQAIVKGTLTVLPDLPPEIAHGIASPINAKSPHPIAIRFANEPSFLQDDRAPGPRGCGIKVFDVQGSFMHPQGAKTHSQDLTFNNAPILELRDLPTTLEIFTIRERHFRDPENITPELEKRDDAELQKAPAQLPNHHFLSYTMYSQSAYRWGPYIVKYALFPTSSQQTALANSHQIDDTSSPEQHSLWLRDWFLPNVNNTSSGVPATYDLRVQLCESLDSQPVEDASVEWDEERFPFRTVAKITLPAGQDVFSPERRRIWDENMKLNVWYGLEEHRPLGSVNRLRKELYERSADFRSRVNAEAFKGVSQVDEIP